MSASPIIRDVIGEIVRANRAGTHIGIPSYCTAHPETLRAIFRAYRGNDLPVLVEATCNQVNQHGGYTGMNPAGFRDFVMALAAGEGLDPARIILGGDHLGPNPWRALPAAEAMDKARALVAAYVEAGFTKIHLDASMACADDATLAEEEIAARAASIAAVAEQSARGARLDYVIGTEVPKPGGETEELGGLSITDPASVATTFDLHREAFEKLGLRDAVSRIIGLVVQPGVDYGNSQIFAFDRPKAASLSEAVFDLPGAVFEAHSTDYQTREGLHDLVAAHFAILKVGPELTAAYREAVVAMAEIERWLPVKQKSDVLDVIERVLLADPKHWRDYVAPGERARLERLFGLSDRIRYYWPNAEIQKALKVLTSNVDTASRETGLIAQFAGIAPGAVSDDVPLSTQIVRAKVGAVVEKYVSVCRA
jgi:D-tagatose-bisphosphate aldolase class II non-catalytic subunit